MATDISIAAAAQKPMIVVICYAQPLQQQTAAS